MALVKEIVQHHGAPEPGRREVYKVFIATCREALRGRICKASTRILSTCTRIFKGLADFVKLRLGFIF